MQSLKLRTNFLGTHRVLLAIKISEKKTQRAMLPQRQFTPAKNVQPTHQRQAASLLQLYVGGGRSVATVLCSHPIYTPKASGTSATDILAWGY